MIGEGLALRGLKKSYGNAAAVRHLSLDITAGEFISILGPSGSGKTTLLTMIAGFEFPDTGTISVGSRNITWVAPNKRNVGMVFQKYALFPHLTVADNIAFPLKMRSVRSSEVRSRIDAALEMVQLSTFGGRYPHELSGGQQQRVAVARALVFRPPVLLMDEPLGALDKKLRESMQLEIKALQARLGATVVYVTHDQEEALTMSDRVAVMAEGELVQVGSPLDLYERPRNSFVADFIGKMNFVTGELIGREGGESIVCISQDRLFKLDCEIEGACAGHRVQMAFRPERARLSAACDDRKDAIRGTIAASVYVGAYRAYIVDVAGERNQTVHVHAEPGTDPRLSVGDKVDVVPHPGALQAFAVREGR